MRALTVLMILVLAVACSKKNYDPVKFVFSGECSVEVVSKTEGADILVDGVHVGEGTVQMNIPCGEKRIMVEKKGYWPYHEYLPTTRTEPLKVTVELKKSHHLEIEALSASLVEKARGPKDAVIKVAKKTGASQGGAPEQKAAAVSDAVENWR
jgi:hypothetical protein